MRIAILGAGVGGLTAAHELAKEGHEVHVYERNPEVGGQARSRFTHDGQHSEYCWHVIVVGYVSCLSILQEIPCEGGSVADRLKPILQFAYGRDGNTYLVERDNSFMSTNSIISWLRNLKHLGSKFTLADMLKLLILKLFIKTAVPERFEHYDSITWMNFMDSLSSEAKKWVVDSPSIFLGMDATRMSTQLMLNYFGRDARSTDFGQRRLKNGNLPHHYSFNGPINQQWFEPWVQYLQKQGVLFFMNTTVKEIECMDNEIKGVSVADGNGERYLQYDYYVNGLSVEGFARALTGTPQLKERMEELGHLSCQLQTQVVYGFQEKFSFDFPTVLYFPDTAWTIAVRTEAPLWDSPMGLNQEPPQEMFSAGIGIWHRKGILYDKPARECTEQEIIDEVWAQIKRSQGLFQHFKTEDGLTLDEVNYTQATIWHSFSYNQESGTFNTWEPKFSNNVGTLALRPPIKDAHLSNLVHANAYALTDSNIFNLDSAAEAGIRAANYINTGQADSNVKKFVQPGWFWRICQYFDSFLHQFGLKNPFELFL